MRCRYVLAIAAVFAVFGLTAIQVRADSFSYLTSVTVSQYTGNGPATVLGTLTGQFRIDTNGVAFNSCSGDCSDGYNTYTDPSVASGTLTWNPIDGPSVPLSIDPTVYTVAGGGASTDFGTRCTFAAGSYCPFLLLVGAPDGTSGFIYVYGTLGEELSVFGGPDGQSGLTIYSPDGSTTVANIFSGVATPTPEPGTFMLFLVGTVMVWLFGRTAVLKRLA